MIVIYTRFEPKQGYHFEVCFVPLCHLWASLCNVTAPSVHSI